MSKEEVDLLLLSALAEVEDLKGKIQTGDLPASGGTAYAVAPGSSDGSSAHQVAGYLKVAGAAVNLANNVSGGGGGGGA